MVAVTATPSCGSPLSLTLVARFEILMDDDNALKFFSPQIEGGDVYLVRGATKTPPD